ncbi:hypothetical protein [Trichocoleus sp. FACHB-262]|uniref:hypothetical protein n=1 Tax=Trichocoleus sp. FACHB-262 TaxID=2692869 RepID=UPI0016896292|nr:hypothetical protein [Trichocoleus sp. FACHB-262]MBD2124249.1 hypothetical protein [Trichocoleus sp. FACHB-262]
MTLNTQVEPEIVQTHVEDKSHSESNAEKILCPHCLRTATNGIKCQGICVADSDY